MFTPEERDRVRAWILAVARADARITGGAVTGSRSIGREDRWSDVDTAFGFDEGVEPDAILGDWTEGFAREFDVVHRFDLHRGPTTYRIFLLGNGLEVDISLTPRPSFGPHGPTFARIFGESVDRPSHAIDRAELIGWGWIYLLYALTAIERNRPWQAEYGIARARNMGFALACLRHGLPETDARGNDDLPPDVTRGWIDSLVRSLDRDELRRASLTAAHAYLNEVRVVDHGLAARLEPILER